MNILLKQVTVADPFSPHNGTVKDILIVNGIVNKIEDSLTEDDAQVIDLRGLTASPGWVDIFSHFCDPGLEYRETLESGADAALAGGFTQVFVLPNTSPVVQNKSQVEYIVQKSKQLPIDVHPIGAVTKGIEGKELAEMYDMQASGAIAFSDGILPIQSSGLMLKALQYVNAFNGVVIQVPQDKSIGQHGLMNEGIISTRLGLPGIPAIAEELIIQRDIELVKYADSKLHITGVSTANGLQLISQAKEENINITCSVTPYHLFFCDEDLQTYDTNLKVNPPLRTREDMMALREGVKNGLVDCIASHHLPQNWDSKTSEFEYAKNGMLGLQTLYAVLNTAIPGLKSGQIANLLSYSVRLIFNLPFATIKEGANAEITIFNPDADFVLQKDSIKSKSLNSPFIQKQLKGKVLGAFTKGKAYISK